MKISFLSKSYVTFQTLGKTDNPLNLAWDARATHISQK